MDSVISVLVALVIFSPVLVLMWLGGLIVWDMVKSASRRRPSEPSGYGSFVSRPSGSSVFSDVKDVAIDTGSYGGGSSSCDSGSSDSGSSDGGGCD
jgi:hypothetical protein